MYVRRTAETRVHNHCCRLNALSITHSECVFVVLGFQHAMCMCRIISSVAPPGVQYHNFPHYALNGKTSGRKVLNLKRNRGLGWRSG